MASKGVLRVKILGDHADLDKTLGSAMGSIGKFAGAAAAAFAAVQVVQFFKDSAQAAMEDAQAQDILHTAIANVTGANAAALTALDSWIEKTQAATGFTEEQLRPAMVKLTSATKDVGAAQDILGIAMDTSKARGVSLETVVLALEKAQNGQTTGLQRLGIATKDAEGNALSFDQILQNLSATYGGTVAVAADTLQGKMERAKLMFGEVKEAIGAALMPVIEKFATWIMDNMPMIQDIMVKFGELVGVALDAIGKVALPLLQKAFETIWPVIQKIVQGFIDWLNSEKGQKLIQAIFVIIQKALEALQQVFELVWPLIQKAIELFVDFLTSPGGQALINALFKGIELALGTLQQVFELVWPLLERIIRTFITFFDSPAGQKLIATLMKAIETALGALLAVFEAVWPAIETVVQIFLDFFNSDEGQWLITTLLDGICFVLDTVAKIWKRVWEGLAPVLRAAGPIVKALLKPIELAIDAIRWAIDKVIAAWRALPFTDNGMAMSVGLNPGGVQFQHGGPIPGSGPIPITAHGGEYVLTKGDTALMQRLIAAVERGMGGGGNFTFYITAPSPEAAGDAVVRRLAGVGVRL